MDKNKLEKYLSQMKGASGSFPFGPEALVFKVMGKMFALVSQNDEIPRVTLKCSPADGEILTGHYPSITPGYHMNKKHWITISLNGEIELQMIFDLANVSYDLVVSNLSKADQKKFMISNDYCNRNT